MNKPTILLATGFVDGRGGSKMCSWFYDEMVSRGYRVIVATNSMYKYKLDELGLKPDVVIKLYPEDSKKTIYEKCAECLNNVHFDYMVSIGWRTYWPYVAFKRKIPYILVDGGIPTSFGKYPTEFIKEVYANTKLFLMTTWFSLEAPKNSLIPNIKIVTQPYPYTRVEKLRLLRNKSKAYCRQLLKNKLPILKTKKFDLFIYLNLSDAYVDPFNHYPNNLNFTDLYNHKMCDYMDFKEIEPSLFFLFNLIAGLETNYQGNVLLYLMQSKTKLISQPIVDMCKKVKTIAPKYLDLNLDPIYAIPALIKNLKDEDYAVVELAVDKPGQMEEYLKMVK